MQQKIIAILLLIFSQVTVANQWAVDTEKSRIAFYPNWQGTEFEVRIQHYEADIRFDPTRSDENGFEVTMDMASLDSDDAERDQAMAMSEWFFSEKFRQATYATESIEDRGNGSYLAHGTLTLKGISRPVALPFSWRQNSGSADMKAEVQLNRNAFNVGEGEWREDDQIGFDVRVAVHLFMKDVNK